MHIDKRLLVKCLLVRLAALLCAVLPIVSPQPARAATPAAQLLLAALESADPTLQTYRAAVEFSVGLHSFPYVRKTLHGDAYFKRPNRMELVITDLPGFAKRFSNLYIGLGTPEEWEKKFAIDAGEAGEPDGSLRPYLILTPRAHDHRLQHVDVFLDPPTSLPARIVWTYRDGRIDVRQQFVACEGHHVIAAQNADIRLPGVHAFVNAVIAHYAINVPVDDAVFTQKAAAQP